MWTHQGEDLGDMRASLARAARDAGVAVERFRPVGHTRWQPLLGDILDQFTVSGGADQDRLWLWDDLKEQPVVLRLRSAVEALEVLAAVLPARQPVWFVAEAATGTKGVGSFWVYEADTDGVVEVLAEHSLFEYYVVDRKLRWLVAENHHGALMAVGEPVASALRELRDAHL